MSAFLSREISSHVPFFPDHQVIRVLKGLRKGMLEVRMPWGEIILFRGNEPGTRANIVVHDSEALDKIAGEGGLGLGEGYMLDLWDTDDLFSLMTLVMENYDVFEKYANGGLGGCLQAVKHNLFSSALRKSRRNIAARYDLGDEFYKLWLDDTLAYSAAMFNGDPGRSLEEAQGMKHQRILNRLRPAKGDHILEIGCGWGGFMQEAARQGHRISGVTISPSQEKYAARRFVKTGVDHLATVSLRDYRGISGRYDHIVSIAAFEHVGEAFWPEYMAKIYDSLKPGGRAMIQSIVVQDEHFPAYRRSTDFIREHIFPGGMLPSSFRLQTEALGAGLEIRDVFCFGKDCALTFERWLERFDRRLTEIRALGYNDVFIRKWRFYLAGCAALFRAGRIDVMQVQLCRN